MATQKGIIKFTGLLGGISFYKSRHAYYARKKSSLDAKRVKTDKAFAPLMLHASEFGAVARLNKALRTTLADMPGVQNNKSTMIRLNKLLLKIKNLDKTSPRGTRSVENGLQTTQGKTLLNGFCLGRQKDILSVPMQVDPATGETYIKAFDPLKQLTVPMGATHLRLEVRVVKMNETHAKTTLIKGKPIYIHLKEKPADLKFHLQLSPGPGMVFYVLSLSFCRNAKPIEGSKNQHVCISCAAVINKIPEQPISKPAKRLWKIRVKEHSMKIVYILPQTKNTVFQNHRRKKRVTSLARPDPLCISW